MSIQEANMCVWRVPILQRAGQSLQATVPKGHAAVDTTKCAGCAAYAAAYATGRAPIHSCAVIHAGPVHASLAHTPSNAVFQYVGMASIV